jgi:hypothetical protein
MHLERNAMGKINGTIWLGTVFLLMVASPLRTSLAGPSMYKKTGSLHNPPSALLSGWPYSLLNSDRQSGTGAQTLEQESTGILTSGETSSAERSPASGIATQVSLQSTTNSLLDGMEAGIELNPNDWAFPLGLAGAYYMITDGPGDNSEIASTPEMGTLTALCLMLAPAFIAFRRKKQQPTR